MAKMAILCYTFSQDIKHAGPPNSRKNVIDKVPHNISNKEIAHVQKSHTASSLW